MGKLSVVSYGGKGVLGWEVAYFGGLLGAVLVDRSSKGTELHHTLFETMPGFTWISIGSVILGFVYMLVFAIIFGAYMVWMHNSSIKE